MLFKENTLEDFYTITGFDAQDFIQRYIDFQNLESQNIINYYSGTDKFARIESFNLMNSLYKEAQRASELFYLNKEAFNSTADWNLLEQLDNIRQKLMTLSNINKYLRSSINKNQFNNTIEIEIKMKQYDTLESIESKELKSTFPQNDWVDLALYNDLIEEDYTPQGGVLLRAPTSNFDTTFLNSVLGNLQGENLYGKDLDRKLQFVNDDLKNLTPKETILQAIDILMKLKRGDNPEFPNNGIQASIFVGGNMASFAYASLFRQILDTFAKDDTVSRISIVNISHKEDAINIEYEIQTKYGERFNQVINI